MNLRAFHLISLSALMLLPAFFGCSRQNEGERCSLLNADSDCDDGLVCTEAESLRSDDEVDRCCPEEGQAPSDARCQLRTTGIGDGDGDVGGAGGEGSGPDDDPTSSLGDNCSYPSDCTVPLVCGPRGTCQVECITARDCDDGEDCNSENVCVPQ